MKTLHHHTKIGDDITIADNRSAEKGPVAVAAGSLRTCIDGVFICVTSSPCVYRVSSIVLDKDVESYNRTTTREQAIDRRVIINRGGRVN